MSSNEFQPPGPLGGWQFHLPIPGAKPRFAATHAAIFQRIPPISELHKNGGIGGGGATMAVGSRDGGLRTILHVPKVTLHGASFSIPRGNPATALVHRGRSRTFCAVARVDGNNGGARRVAASRGAVVCFDS
jgi:hypothetical protein